MAINRRELHEALVAAFPVVGTFQALIVGMGKSWVDFAGAGVVEAQAMVNVIARAEADQWTHLLLKEIVTTAAGANPLIVKFIRNHPDLDPAKAPAIPADPYQ